MKIKLKPYAKPIKYWPYQINPQVKEKLKWEIDHMLSTKVILVEKSNCINSVVIQSKKYIEEIIVCVEFQSLNFACIHDPFPTPLSDEILN